MLAAVHPHPLAATTLTLPVPPPVGNVWFAGEIEYVHPAAPPACVTVNVFPAIVSVPVRCGPLLAATAYSTVPFPLPLAPAVTVTKPELLTAVHAHPLVVITFTLPLPPLAENDCTEEEIE